MSTTRANMMATLALIVAAAAFVKSFVPAVPAANAAPSAQEQPVAAAEQQSISLQAAAIASTVPPYLNYQGILRDGEGKLLSGEYDMTFRIYDAPEGGNVRWDSEIIPSVTVRDGRFSVLLGNSKPLTDPTIFATPDTYLGVTVAGFGEMVPLQRFASVPYAIVAGALNGQDITTLDPRSELVIHNSSTASDPGANGASILIEGGDGQYGIWMGADSNNPWIGAMTDHDLRITAGGKDKMWLTRAGHLGIGAPPDPLRDLHVHGEGIRLSNGHKSIDLLAKGRGVDLLSYSNSVVISSRGQGACPWDCNNVLINPEPNSGDGNVGIGRTNPQAKLHVAGDIRVDGSMGDVLVNSLRWRTNQGNNVPPVVIRRYENIGDGADIRIDFGAHNNNASPMHKNDWNCIAAGWSAAYDHGSGDGANMLWTYTRGDYWHLRASFHSPGSNNENPDVDVLCIWRGLSLWQGIPATGPAAVDALRDLNDPD